MDWHPFWKDMEFLIGLRRGALLGWLVGMAFAVGMIVGMYLTLP